MAFKLRTNDIPATPPLEYLQGTAGETYTNGEALVVASGKVTKCGPTAKPLYIAAAEMSIPAGGAGLVPCFRVHATMMFDTTLYAAGSLTEGTKVQLHTDGGQVTTSTTTGVAEIIAFEGTAAGDRVCVRFS